MGKIITSLVEKWRYDQRWRGYQKERMANWLGQVKRNETLRAIRRARRLALSASQDGVEGTSADGSGEDPGK